MAIRILESPEPLSAQSMLAEVDCILVQSDASRLLIQELKRYRNRQVTGRSFLIAGHRGSGKTTLVLDAYLRVLKESQRFSMPSRPLLVPLHGPNLLPDLTEIPVASDADSDATERPTQHVLKQITLALYRALAGEMASCYRQRIVDFTAKDFPAELRPANLRELFEMASQLEMELYDCPDAARLREFWERAGFLKDGVLLPRRVLPKDSKQPEQITDAGLREIIALASACEAYKRVAGTYSSKEEQVEEAKHTRQMTSEFDAGNKDLWSAAIALATGGLAGAALFTGENGIAAAAGGLVTALGAASVIKFSSTRSRDRSRKREQSFVFDLSTPTLDRVLPMICERMARAGLMPVFMVDELDKVSDLHKRMGGMINHLKKFVAESAFFCFLTDRSYFEQVRHLTTTVAHPPEETYFKHPIVVVFTARDLHAYLDRIVERPTPPAAANAEPDSVAEQPEGTDDPEARAARTVEQDKQQQAVTADLTDYPLISYVLLHRARLHAGGLQRELAAITSEKLELALPPGRIRTMRSCRFDLLIQVAVEHVLDQQELREALEREPERRMLVHDALYYISREWANGATKLDLSDEGVCAFRTYLLTRIAGSLDASEKDIGIKLSTEAATELYEHVRNLARLIAAPETLKSELSSSESRPAAEVMDAIPISTSPMGLILERQGDSGHRYRWRYQYAGFPLKPPAGAIPEASPVAAVEAPAMAPPISPQAEPAPPVCEPESQPAPAAKGGTAPSPAPAPAPAPAPTASPSPSAITYPLSTEGWGPAVQFIKEFARILHDRTAGLVDFATLSTRFRVIKTSPAWEEVDRAMKRLDMAHSPGSSGRYPDYEDDVSHVIEFESLLNDSMATIGAALVCGALVGRASRSQSQGRAIYLGLKTISDAYLFANESEGGVYRSLGLVGDFYEDSKLDETPFPWGLDKPELEPFASRLEDLLEHVGNLKVKPEFLEGSQRGAWKHWMMRLPMIPGPAFPLYNMPQIEDLVCAAAGLRPSNLLQLRTSEMSARAWSNAFFWAVDDTVPTNRQICKSWVAPAAMRALGLSARDPAGLHAILLSRGVELHEDEAKTHPQLYSLQPLPPCDSALVVIAAKNSLATNWAQSTRGAVLLLTLEQLDRLLAAHAYLLRMLSIDNVVFEEPINEEDVNRILGHIRQHAAGTPLAQAGNAWRLTAKVVRERALNLPNRAPESQRPDQLVAPKSIEDLFDQMMMAPPR